MRGSSLTGFTLELSLAVAQAGAAHHVTVLSVAIPLLANAVVVAVVVTPLCGGSRERQGAESEDEAERSGGRRPGAPNSQSVHKTDLRTRLHANSQI